MSAHKGVEPDTEMGGVACSVCGWHLSGRFTDGDEQCRMHDEAYPGRMKLAEVCHDRWWDDDGKPWKVYVYADGVIPDRAEQILYRDSDAVGNGFPTHADALAHALAEVGLTPSTPEPMEAP